MKPGRELDALIAEKIFGWENNKDGPTFVGARYEQIYADSGDWKVIDCPCYSTDISAAWEIVGWFDRFVLTKCDMPEHYYAKIVHYLGAGSFKEYQVKADTAPHAICLVALESIKNL